MTTRFNGQSRQYAAAEKKLAEALRRVENEPPLPKAGDYIRITNKLDSDFGRAAEVLWIENRDRPGPKTIHIMLNPFGDYLKIRRPIDPGCFRILNGMEVIAEASR